MNVRDKLAEYTRLMNLHGADAPEVKEFVDRHSDDEEFLDLVNLTRRLQRALTAPATYSTN